MNDKNICDLIKNIFKIAETNNILKNKETTLSWDNKIILSNIQSKNVRFPTSIQGNDAEIDLHSGIPFGKNTPEHSISLLNQNKRVEWIVSICENKESCEEPFIKITLPGNSFF